jgi:hypothetical protein
MNASLNIPDFTQPIPLRSSTQAGHLRATRFWLGILIAGLILSGVTAFALETELHWLASTLRIDALRPIAESTSLLEWITRVEGALSNTNRAYSFLAYGTDWLAFAHLVIAVAFVGAFRDPVRNKWLVTFGLIACAGIFPLAVIAGHLRGIPMGWRLVDCSFGILGSIPLLMCRHHIRALEQLSIRRTRPVTQWKRLFRSDLEEDCGWLR